VRVLAILAVARGDAARSPAMGHAALPLTVDQNRVMFHRGYPRPLMVLGKLRWHGIIARSYLWLAAAMGIAMAIYRLLRGSVSFDSEAIQSMHAAYEEVCAELSLKCKIDHVMEVAAIRIIEVAKTGERDIAALRDSALKELGLKR
jgi:hypothetical protein